MSNFYSFILFIILTTSFNTSHSQVVKKIIGTCDRKESSLFSDISEIIFVSEENYNFYEIKDTKDEFSYDDLFLLNVYGLELIFKDKFNVSFLPKSQLSNKLNPNALYIDFEKIKIKTYSANSKQLTFLFNYTIQDSKNKEFSFEFFYSNYKRKKQFWFKDKNVYERVFYYLTNPNNYRDVFKSSLEKLGSNYNNNIWELINNPTDLCIGNVKYFISEEEINRINFKEAEKSFLKYWKKNFLGDPVEGIYNQTNYYSYNNEPPEVDGLLNGDLYRVAVLLDDTKEFYNVYYLFNILLDFEIADLIAKIYKTSEKNVYEIFYTKNFLSKSKKSAILNNDKLEFGSYMEPSGDGYDFSISNTKYLYYKENKSGSKSWSVRFQSETSDVIALKSDGFFIKYNQFDNSFNFDAFFKKITQPKRAITNLSVGNKKILRTKNIKKKSPPPDAKIID